MRKVLAFVLFVVYGHCVFACDELIYSTQCAYNKFTQANGVVSIEDYHRVVEDIINTINKLKSTTCSSETNVDCCCDCAENSFESNCDLFLAELWELLEGDVSKKIKVSLQEKSELVNKVKSSLDQKSINMLGY